MASRKRVFIAFAAEDKNYRDFLVGQARNENSPFDFVDMSVKNRGTASGRRTAERRSRAAMA